MADEEQVHILLRDGAAAWNRWREEHLDVRPDLTGLIYSEMSLQDVNLSWGDLDEANLSMTRFQDVDLKGVNFGRANLALARLRGADLRWANLWRADLGEADLREADLRGAKLVLADLSRAELSGADLSGAEVGWTVFGNMDLGDVKGLELVEHRYPSTIGIDTVYASRGRIPEVFLRGAGVPDEFITYMGSLVGRAIEYYSCFISYSHEDQAFAERLHADLQAKGVRCWFAPHDLKIGERFRQRIDEAIRFHDKLLLVLSEHSIESDWVATEVEAAFEKERQRAQTVLFPVRIDDPVMITNQA